MTNDEPLNPDLVAIAEALARMVAREDHAIGVATGRHKLRRVRLAAIPEGAWPRRMSAAYAAGYCGEKTVEAFLKRVGSEYPHPRVMDGRRQLWLRDDLDAAIAPGVVGYDLADDL